MTLAGCSPSAARAAARRRDGEVPARHVLLQRRRGGPVRRRGARAGAVAARRADLRPEAGDERRARRPRRSSTRVAGGRAALRDHQLRQPRHGRPHRRDPGGGRRRSRRSTRCLGEVVERGPRERAARCVITADHGNADHMLEPDGSPNTAHSLNPVPLIVTVDRRRRCGDGGILADVAPTLLQLLGERAARRDDGPLAASTRDAPRAVAGRCRRGRRAGRCAPGSSARWRRSRRMTARRSSPPRRRPRARRRSGCASPMSCCAAVACSACDPRADGAHRAPVGGRRGALRDRPRAEPPNAEGPEPPDRHGVAVTYQASPPVRRRTAAPARAAHAADRRRAAPHGRGRELGRRRRWTRSRARSCGCC